MEIFTSSLLLQFSILAAVALITAALIVLVPVGRAYQHLLSL
jgi:uncharacterized membrane protein YjjB (DUF3815 family)